MNRVERQKILALKACRMMPASWEKSFTNSLVWLEEHSPDIALSSRQKWALDSMLWRFRRQLAGRELPFALPSTPPVEEAYQPKMKPTRQPGLFESSS